MNQSEKIQTIQRLSEWIYRHIGENRYMYEDAIYFYYKVYGYPNLYKYDKAMMKNVLCR